MSSTAASAFAASVLPTPASPSSSSGCGSRSAQEHRRRQPLVHEVVDRGQARAPASRCPARRADLVSAPPVSRGGLMRAPGAARTACVVLPGVHVERDGPGDRTSATRPRRVEQAPHPLVAVERRRAPPKPAAPDRDRVPAPVVVAAHRQRRVAAPRPAAPPPCPGSPPAGRRASAPARRTARSTTPARRRSTTSTPPRRPRSPRPPRPPGRPARAPPSAAPPIATRSWSNRQARATPTTWPSSVPPPKGRTCFGRPEPAGPAGAQHEPRDERGSVSDGMLVLRRERGPAAVAAEVDGLAVVLERGRAGHDRDGHPADRVDRGRGRRRPDGRRGRRRRGPRPHLDDPGQDRQRDLGRACARRCRGRRARRCGRGAPRARRRPAARRARRRPACGWPPGRRRARPASSAAPEREQLVAAVRRDDQGEVAGARGDAVGPVRVRRRRAQLGADPHHRARDRRSPPTTSTRGAGTTGSRKTSIAPPDRHGFCTVTAPSSTWSATPVLGERQDPQQHGLAALDRLQGVGADAVLGARAADEPLDRAVGQHQRDVARPHARGPLGADDRGRHERRALRGELLRPPDMAAFIIAAAPGGPASRPTRARGCRACRCGPRRGVSCSASMTAFTIAGGEPTFGDSPTPLAPSGWCGQGVTVSPELEVGALERRRDQVVHERRVEAVALLVEADQLHQRDADALGQPAVDLAVDDHRVDPHAAVVHRDEAADRDLGGVGVDVDDGDVGAVRVGQVRRVVDDLARRARPPCPRASARRCRRARRCPRSARPSRGRP